VALCETLALKVGIKGRPGRYATAVDVLFVVAVAAVVVDDVVGVVVAGVVAAAAAAVVVVGGADLLCAVVVKVQTAGVREGLVVMLRDVDV